MDLPRATARRIGHGNIVIATAQSAANHNPAIALVQQFHRPPVDHMRTKAFAVFRTVQSKLAVPPLSR
ncbi:MAG: hypothetical protein BGP04_13340 [Rhizobiales bacterium 62-17]|nr:MAG: hypothetical protein BGP04_13340 [Rhizobiales bacterium 62-17]